MLGFCYTQSILKLLNILIANRLYYPILGGSVVLTDAIANALDSMGHVVKITTKTPDLVDSSNVLRTSSFWELVKATRWSDAMIIIEPSLVYFAAAALARRPAVACLQTWCRDKDGKILLTKQIQQRVGRALGTITSPSHAVSDNWGGGHKIIPNGFEDKIFSNYEKLRSYDYTFIGRMIADKGPDLFIESFIQLHQKDPTIRALIIGDGDLLPLCQEKVFQNGISTNVTFTGNLRERTEVAKLLNRSHVVVIPNRWDEPFGMVALEALACGCRLVVSQSGALPEFAGKYASVVEKENIQALTEAMLYERIQVGNPRPGLSAHLENFKWSNIVRQYLELLLPHS